VYRVHEECGAAAPDVVRAYIATREIFGFVPFWKQIEALDNQVADATQTAIVVAAQQLIMHGTLWFLRRRSHLADLDVTLRRFAPRLAELMTHLDQLLAPSYLREHEAEVERLSGLGVPLEAARRTAAMDVLHSALDIVEVAEETGNSTTVVGEIYSTLDERLNLHWLWRQIAALPSDSHWQSMARKALLDDVANQMRELTAGVLRLAPCQAPCADLLAGWENQLAYQIKRWEQVRTELQPAGSMDISMIQVALRELHALVPSPVLPVAQAPTQ
jgi:glutamate dehydrogenase